MRLVPSVEYFKKAVTLDPKYGLAWSGLADAYNMVAFYGLARSEACLPPAKEAAQRAIALDPLLARHIPPWRCRICSVIGIARAPSVNFCAPWS
jgi:hypothetical protein